jgi:hypothetical protein
VSRERTAKDFILTTAGSTGDIDIGLDSAQRGETKTTKILGTPCRLIHLRLSYPPHKSPARVTQDIRLFLGLIFLPLDHICRACGCILGQSGPSPVVPGPGETSQE